MHPALIMGTLVGLVWTVGTTLGFIWGLRIGRRNAERHWINGCNIIFDHDERRPIREYTR